MTSGDDTFGSVPACWSHLSADDYQLLMEVFSDDSDPCRMKPRVRKVESAMDTCSAVSVASSVVWLASEMQ